MDKNAAKDRLEQGIAARAATAGNVIQHVMATVPHDSLVRAQAIRFRARYHRVGEHDRARLVAGVEGEHGVHRHALGQMASRAGVPGAWLAKCTEPTAEVWETDMAAEVLNRCFSNAPAKERNLVRAVRTAQGEYELRGFLSDRYRRLDCRPLVDAFADQVQQSGGVAYSGHATDLVVAIKAVSPDLVQLSNGDWIAMGIEFSNSDFGAGALNLRTFILRLVCLNGATAEDTMRSVHLGARIADGFRLSERTLRLDTETTVGALRDVVKGVMGGSNRAAMIERISAATAAEVNWTQLKRTLAKKVTKDELRKIEEAYTGPDVENLPPGNTLWRVSNAMSWVAHSLENAGRKLEFERMAGSALNGQIEYDAVAA